MKLSITDKFLWDLYNATYKTGDVLDMLLFPPRTMGQMFIKLDKLFVQGRNHKNRNQFNKFIHYLKTKGYIKSVVLEGKKAVIITKDGIGKVLKASFKLEEKTKRKDDKWVMLIFDMPAKRKKSRDLLRSILQNLGYKLFQQSVWITPYDVSEKTEKLLQLYSLEKYVKIFLIEEI